jgi:hypothetical protein
VTWDAAGYIHGWWLDAEGQTNRTPGSCPHTVWRLVELLLVLATCDDDWRELLNRHADALKVWWLKSVERAEMVADERVAAQSWWKRLTRPTNQTREMLSFGFGPGSDGKNSISPAPLNGEMRPSHLARAISDATDE